MDKPLRQAAGPGCSHRLTMLLIRNYSTERIYQMDTKIIELRMAIKALPIDNKDIQNAVKAEVDRLAVALDKDHAALTARIAELEAALKAENSELMTYIRDTGSDIETNHQELLEWAQAIYDNCGEGENFNNTLYSVVMEMREKAGFYKVQS
jgi:hypothetical protein